MNIAIVGLGYVGAVSAACLADSGHYVWGVDVNAEKVRIINEGRSPIVENGLADKIGDAKGAGRLHATVNIEEALRETELCFVAVATPSRPSGQIDPAHLFRACNQIADALKKIGKKQTVAVRSSILPIIFDECRKIFDSVSPGLAELCVNPEFLREGTAIRDFQKPPFILIGTDSANAEAALRSLYCKQRSPVFVLRSRDALMVKYASNAFHALKVAFANEIAAVCEQSGVDAEAVMNVFCSDSALNISRRYLMPGFAFGGSCLPKDLRAILYAGKHLDLQLPLVNAILSSNQEVIERAFEKIRATGKHRLALIGLSFKPNTDDLRESPYVDLAERLLGKGYDLRIYDPNVVTARLTGANKEYIDAVIPHLSRLLVGSLPELADAELIIIGHHFEGLDGLLARTNASVLDLAGTTMETHSEAKTPAA
jgi:GDP-mannose 6-dehydrogenase